MYISSHTKLQTWAQGRPYNSRDMLVVLKSTTSVRCNELPAASVCILRCMLIGFKNAKGAHNRATLGPIGINILIKFQQKSIQINTKFIQNDVFLFTLDLGVCLEF